MYKKVKRERRGVLHGRCFAAGKRLSELEEVRFGDVAVLVMAGVSTLRET
jgi:hypothetical protein